MQIPKSFLEELRTRADIISVIADYISLRKTGTNFVACCPFHNEKTPSFSVSPKLQRYHCFGCGASGDSIQFLRQFKQIEFLEAVKLLAHKTGLPLPQEQMITSKYDRYHTLYQLHEQACVLFESYLQNPSSNFAKDYLLNRGLDAANISRFRIGLSFNKWDTFYNHAKNKGFSLEDMLESGLVLKSKNGEYGDRFRHRIMFPIRNYQGKVIAFGGRAFNDSLPKYLNSPQTPLFHKSDILYGLFEARTSNPQLNTLIIVEGYMDVIALTQAGISNVSATLGTALTTQHLETAFKYTTHVLFCFDGDRAGRRAAWKALNVALPFLNEQKYVSFVFLPETHDPDTLIREEGGENFSKRLSDAQTATQFLIQTLKAHYDIQSDKGRARFIQHTKFMAEKMTSPITQHFLYEQIALNARTNVEFIKNYSSKNVKKGEISKTRTLSSSILSPIQTALILLYKYPEFISHIQNIESLKQKNEEEFNLFIHMIEILSMHPHITQEDFCDFLKEMGVLEKLENMAQHLPNFPKAEWIEEFKGALQRIIEQDSEQKINFYIQKLSTEGLTSEERENLQLILKASSKSPQA